MTRRLTVIVEREGKGYVALCPEVDVASQGASVVEARDNLAEALALFFEAAPGEEIDRRLRGEVYVTQIEVAVGQAACPVGARSLSNSRCQWLRRSAKTRNERLRAIPSRESAGQIGEEERWWRGIGVPLSNETPAR